MMATGAPNEWYMVGGGAKCAERENKCYIEINEYVFLGERAVCL